MGKTLINNVINSVKSDITLNDSVFLNANALENVPNTIKTSQKTKIEVQSSQNQTQNIISTQEKLSLQSWDLPTTVLEKYKARGLENMFQWQAECLSNPYVLLENKNLVYSAPTSAGKTLVAEILALKTVIERRKKVIIILPFVSVVREKMFYFQDILSSSGVRVDGFMGSYNPPGGFKMVNLAICTIEKANGIINRLMEEGRLDEIGAVVIDEMHLLGDPSRGYLLELLLTKIKYMSVKNEITIQLIGMSATLPNLDLLAKWLNAELYTTNFRPIPLQEFCLVNGEIYNNNLKLERKLQPIPELCEDTDNILQICLETISMNCSVLIFCPTKNWCENLSQQIAVAFYKLGRTETFFGKSLREQLNFTLINEALEQLQRCPVGLDTVLKKTVTFGVAFHHAGLTMDERDILEGAFRNGALRVLVATSTLSSGVNLPARRVIVRTPIFHGRPIDTLTYRQMIGRAGRMGKDTAGESILICQPKDKQVVAELMSANLHPIESCLEGAGKLKRAILEVIASGVASTVEDVQLFTNSTLLAVCDTNFENNDPITRTVDFLVENEFIRLQNNEKGELHYVPTSLAKACLSSSLPPEDGLALFEELEKARRCFVLDTELHLLYLVTPYSVCNQWTNLDWMSYLNLWENLPACDKRVADMVGVRESFIFNGTQGKINTNSSKIYHRLQIHRRFYTALALQDLVNEVSLNDVAKKFQCSRGMLQSLQQSASTFAGMVTAFSRQLGWTCVEILISQFQDRLQFGIHHELLDLMKLPLLNGPRARTLYNSDIKSLIDLASFDVCKLENILISAVPFQSEKGKEGESEFDIQQKKKLRTFWITGQNGLTAREAAEILIKDARKYLQHEMGAEVNWEQNYDSSDSYTSDSNDSCTSESIVSYSTESNDSLNIRNSYVSNTDSEKENTLNAVCKKIHKRKNKQIDKKYKKGFKKKENLKKNMQKSSMNLLKSNLDLNKSKVENYKNISKTAENLVIKNGEQVHQNTPQNVIQHPHHFEKGDNINTTPKTKILTLNNENSLKNVGQTHQNTPQNVIQHPHTFEKGGNINTTPKTKILTINNENSFKNVGQTHQNTPQNVIQHPDTFEKGGNINTPLKTTKFTINNENSLGQTHQNTPQNVIQHPQNFEKEENIKTPTKTKMLTINNEIFFENIGQTYQNTPQNVKQPNFESEENILKNKPNSKILSSCIDIEQNENLEINFEPIENFDCNIVETKNITSEQINASIFNESFNFSNNFHINKIVESNKNTTLDAENSKIFINEYSFINDSQEDHNIPQNYENRDIKNPKNEKTVSSPNIRQSEENFEKIDSEKEIEEMNNSLFINSFELSDSSKPFDSSSEQIFKDSFHLTDINFEKTVHNEHKKDSEIEDENKTQLENIFQDSFHLSNLNCIEIKSQNVENITQFEEIFKESFNITNLTLGKKELKSIHENRDLEEKNLLENLEKETLQSTKSNIQNQFSEIINDKNCELKIKSQNIENFTQFGDIFKESFDTNLNMEKELNSSNNKSDLFENSSFENDIFDTNTESVYFKTTINDTRLEQNSISDQINSVHTCENNCELKLTQNLNNSPNSLQNLNLSVFNWSTFQESKSTVTTNLFDVSNKSDSLFEDSIESKILDTSPQELKNVISINKNVSKENLNISDDLFDSEETKMVFNELNCSHNSQNSIFEKAFDSSIIESSQNEVLEHKEDIVDTSQNENLDYNTVKKGKKRRKNCLEVLEAPKKKKKISGSPKKLDTITVNSQNLQKFYEKILKQSEIAISISCERYDVVKKKIGQNLVTPKPKKGEISNFVVDNRKICGISFYWGDKNYYLEDFKTELLQKIFNNENLKIRIYDAKEYGKILYKAFKIKLNSLKDPKIGDWILNPEDDEKNLQKLVSEYCPELKNISRLIPEYPRTSSVALSLDCSSPNQTRATVESFLTWHIIDAQKKMFSNEKLFKTLCVENDTILCLIEKELEGLGVDSEKINNLVSTIQEQMFIIEKQAYKLAGRHFSFASSKDCAKVLGMYKGKKVSTNKQKLEQLEDPLADLILQWRKLSCILSKMLFPVLRCVKNNRIYGCCITRTATGRISMHEPNLQSIPRNFDLRLSDGKIIPVSVRACFVPTEGKVFVSADFCQLELRLLAHLSRDTTLCDIMRSDEDIFKSIASKVYNVSKKKVSDNLRQQAKQLCYGIIYGMGARTLSDQLQSSEEEAKEFMDTFKNTYPAVKKYIEDTISRCREKGYIETLGGRKRFLSHINHEKAVVRSQAERQAVNTTVQGSAADIAKTAMVLVHKEFNENFSSEERPCLVLHIHDELLYEVASQQLMKAARLIKNSMESAVHLSIPFPVKVKTGTSWGEMIELEL